MKVHSQNWCKMKISSIRSL